MTYHLNRPRGRMIRELKARASGQRETVAQEVKGDSSNAIADNVNSKLATGRTHHDDALSFNLKSKRRRPRRLGKAAYGSQDYQEPPISQPRRHAVKSHKPAGESVQRKVPNKNAKEAETHSELAPRKNTTLQERQNRLKKVTFSSYESAGSRLPDEADEVLIDKKMLELDDEERAGNPDAEEPFFCEMPTGEPTTVSLQQHSLLKALDQMNQIALHFPLGMQWEEELVLGKGEKEDRVRWMQRHEECIQSETSRALVEVCIGLWKLIDSCPSALDLETQSQYLNNTSAAFARFISEGNRLVKETCTALHKYPEILKGDHLSINAVRAEVRFMLQTGIPLLVFNVKATAVLGSGQALSHSRTSALTSRGTFSASTLQLQLCLLRWTKQIVDVSTDLLGLPGTFVGTHVNSSGASVHEWSPILVRRLRRHLVEMNQLIRDHLDAVEQAVSYLDELTKELFQKKAAMEEDYRLKLQGVKSWQQHSERITSQMRLFVQSTQQSRPVTQHERDWSLQEDKVLLERTRAKGQSGYLDISTLLLSERSTQAVERRIAFLRAFVRAKYENEGKAPPRWCYA